MNLQSLHFHSPAPLNLPSNKNLLFHRAFTHYLPSSPYHKFTSNSKPHLGLFSFRTRISESTIIMRNHGDSVEINCGESVVKDDAFYMKRCVEIASKAIGCTSPNPMVGCVLVKDGVVVGEGFHPKAGQPHAEVFALRNAGDLAENATAYVSLEPCNHYGRTPPCTEALIRAKVKRVVVGMVDPNPIVTSKGVKSLRESGIDVIAGVEEELCRRLNEAYIYRMLTGKPFLTLRYSLSVNGGLIDQFGEGAKDPGGYYSQLLQEYDGVIYSSAAITGNPFPTSQEPHAKQPLQIIVAKSPNSLAQLPDLTAEDASQFIIFTDSNTVVDSQLTQVGVETVILEQLNLSTILEYCAQRGLCSVLLDLNGSLGDLKELVEESLHTGLLQKVVIEILPLWGENKEALTLVNLEKRLSMLKKLQSKTIGDTVVISGYF